ncbi:CARDB domain-containing protein [Longimicrobium sp.]|uniref:CARDB domain-containing protein n=1 Tax=Longimicrobium sp. TaxID=2029185 RepID=UPI002CCED586|nr:CARDB domain-containing protein [Longimicrobium sp.]HSU15630.1 CARDB domain-containing protein [Longimicrobium sp.]
MKYRLAFLAFCAAMSIAAAAAPPPRPDLIVGAVVASNGIVTIRVHNQGNAPAAACKVNLSLGTPIGTAHSYDQPAIPAGQWRSVTIHVNKPLAGVHYTVRDDVTHIVTESNETNNARAGNF